MNKNTIVSLMSFFLSVGVTDSLASTPKDVESLTIRTGKPTVTGESAISTSVLWRIDDRMRYSGTGLTFINGLDTSHPDGAVVVATKMLTSINESMMAQEPSWRGVEVKQISKSGDQKDAILKVFNKQGHSLNAFVIRDYTNQQSISYQVKPSFSEDGVSAAIDMVYIESADGSNPFLSVGKKIAQVKQAKGGGVEVVIGDRGAVAIETANLTTEQIEEKLASALSGSGGYVSSNQLVEDVKDGTTRNVKQFDGQEVQFKSLRGNAISLSVKDPSIAALVKLKYQDENNTMSDVPMPVILLVLVGVIGGVGYFYWKSKVLNQDQVA